MFLVLDAKDRFWQVKLTEESSYLRWLIMTFAINTAPEQYQRTQTEDVSDPPGVHVVADDHLVFGCGNTMEEACKDHDDNLHGLQEGARKIRLRLNSHKKCDCGVKK